MVGRSRHGPTSMGLQMVYTDVYLSAAGLGMDLHPRVYTWPTLMYTRSRHGPTSTGLHMVYTDVYEV